MKKGIFATLLFVLVVAGCKSKIALEYSNYIVELEKSLLVDLQKTRTAFPGFIGAGQYDSASTAAKGMEKTIAEKITLIENKPAPDVKGGEDFKKESLHYFEYLKSVYTAAGNLASQTTAEDREIALKTLQDIEKEETKVLERMKDAQKRYASANGFKIE